MFAILMSLFLGVTMLTAEIPFLSANEIPLEAVAEEISLPQAIELMKKQHPDIRLQEAAIEKAKEEVKLAARAFLPDVDIDYILSSATGGWGLILTAAKLIKPVFSFKKLVIEKEVKKILWEKAEVLIRYRELEVEQGIRELYVTLLIQRELARVLGQNADRIGERFELVKVHHTEGGLNEEELLKEKSAYEQAQAEAGKAEAWFRQSKFAFKRLIGLPVEKTLSLAPVALPAPETFPLSLEVCLAVAYGKNSIVQALLLEEKASFKRLGIKEPQFEMDGAFLGFGEASGGVFSGKPRIGLTGSLILYDWGKANLKKKILGFEHSQLLLKHKKEFQAFEQAIAKSYFELERLQKEIAESGAKSELFRETKRRDGILAEMGRKRQTDLLSFKNEFILHETRHWQKRLEYFLVRERLIKDLGLKNLNELKKVTV